MIYTLTLNPAIDHTIYIDELNEEDVTRVKKTLKDPAGKGINVSKVLKTLHLDSICLGFIAGKNGEFIQNELTKKGVSYNFVEVHGETRENIKVIASQNHKVIELNEVGPRITNIDVQEIVFKLDTLLKKNDILVLSGSVTSNVRPTIYKDIIERYKDVFTIVDASGELFEKTIASRPNVVKPNLYELETFVKKPLKSDSSIIHACEKLLELGIEHVFVSLGSKGTLYVSKDKVYKAQVPSVDVKSTVGAGDAFVAGLTYGFHHHFDIEKTLQYASAVGTASVMTEGTADVDPIDVNELYYLVKVSPVQSKA